MNFTSGSQISLPTLDGTGWPEKAGVVYFASPTWNTIGWLNLEFSFFFFLRFYLSIHERQREREAETQAEEEAGSMQGASCGTRSQVSGITPWAKGWQ